MSRIDAKSDRLLTDWRERLAYVAEMMRDMSSLTDPQEVVRHYADRVRSLNPMDRLVAVSRRDLDAPRYRITRSNTWDKQPNPWKDQGKLPLFEGGVLGEWIYSNRPRLLDDFTVDESDPAADYLRDHRTIAVIPQFDKGQALNMVVLGWGPPGALDPEKFPDLVLQSNLFGRATQNLVLAEQLREAYSLVDQELKVVSDIQRALLPSELPVVPGVDLAAYYQTSRAAGGDYYDFFPLPDGKWGILIADVSGHGTPAAVVMAITHSNAHGHPRPPAPASKLLAFLNQTLCRRYVIGGTFVTAFYGVYDPKTRILTYASAGHNPPRVCRPEHSGGGILSLDAARRFPLGVDATEQFEDASQQLERGDKLVLYTDGIVEARNPRGELFNLHRLDALLGSGALSAAGVVADVIDGVRRFAEGKAAEDDRTLVVWRLT